MNERTRNILAIGSFGITVAGVGLQFGFAWSLIVAGATGITVALVLAIGAVR